MNLVNETDHIEEQGSVEEKPDTDETLEVFLNVHAEYKNLYERLQSAHQFTAGAAKELTLIARVIPVGGRQIFINGEKELVLTHLMDGFQIDQKLATAQISSADVGYRDRAN